MIQGFDSFLSRDVYNPRRARGSQSGREKRRDESFQIREKELLGTDSHRTISKNSGGFRLLIGQKKCVVLLCPIGEQFLRSSFREFIHDGYFLVKQAYRRGGSFRYCVITPRASVTTNLLLKVGELIMHSANPLIGQGWNRCAAIKKLLTICLVSL